MWQAGRTGRGSLTGWDGMEGQGGRMGWKDGCWREEDDGSGMGNRREDEKEEGNKWMGRVLWEIVGWVGGWVGREGQERKGDSQERKKTEELIVMSIYQTQV